MDRRKLSDKQSGWLGHVEACLAGGVSMKAYAQKHGLDLQSFYLWKGRLKKLGVVSATPGALALPSDQVEFAPINRSSAKPSGKMRIEFSNGVMIDAPCGFSVDDLAALMKAAMNLS